MPETNVKDSSYSKVAPSIRLALLVGKEPHVKSALSQVLGTESWELDVVENLEEAMAATRTRKVTLIVTNPESSGKEDVEFLRRIRRVSPRTRVIILTDESTPEDVIASMREHALAIAIESLYTLAHEHG